MSSHDASPAAVQVRLSDVSASSCRILSTPSGVLIVMFRDVDMEGDLGSFVLTGKLPGVNEVGSICPSIAFIKEVRKHPGKARTVVKGQASTLVPKPKVKIAKYGEDVKSLEVEPKSKKAKTSAAASASKLLCSRGDKPIVSSLIQHKLLFFRGDKPRVSSLIVIMIQGRQGQVSLSLIIFAPEQC